jgi:hypothetical protein
MEFTVVDQPWRHVIVDNFLPDDFFSSIKDLGEKVSQQQKWGIYGFDERNYPDLLNSSVTDCVISSYLGVKHYLKNTELWNIMSQFDEVRPHDHDALDIYGTLCVHPPGYQYKIHDEAFHKILSIVIYISPDVNRGTMIHSNQDGGTSYEIEWKPNRSMIFAGKTGFTWHSYQANDTPRITMNFFAFENRH